MVIDTGIFIEYLRSKNKSNTVLFKIADNSHLYISSVSFYELYMGATSSEKQDDVNFLTEDLTVLTFSKDVAIKASEIYHKLRTSNQMIEFRDIFIAATCIVNNLPIVTLNKKHFERIEELKLIDLS